MRFENLAFLSHFHVFKGGTYLDVRPSVDLVTVGSVLSAQVSVLSPSKPTTGAVCFKHDRLILRLR